MKTKKHVQAQGTNRKAQANPGERKVHVQSGEIYFAFVNRLLEALSLIVLVVIPTFFLPDINSS